jgi:hypothetical protein
MFPLIPAILLLLLQGSTGFERLPQSGRVPHQWQTLQRGNTVGDLRVEAALVRFLTIAAQQQAISSSETAGQAETALEPESTPVLCPAISPPPQDGFQNCRRSRDGPDSIA